MAILELLQSAIVAILSGYLAFTGMLADGISTVVGTSELEQRTAESAEHLPKPQSEENREADMLAQLPSEYEYGGPIPRILLENLEYQDAGQSARIIDGLAQSPENALDAIVNIFCQYTTEDQVRTTTGTGFFIHESGVVLTNAHVAQFLLLERIEGAGTTECVLRTGDPATTRYKADLLYISPAWISENAKLVTDEFPTGTGERDYALLYVSASLGDTGLPDDFPTLRINTSLLPRTLEGAGVLATGYPAEAIYREGPEAELSPIVDETTIRTMYTFGSNYADLITISDSAVGEHGSSGGPVIQKNNEAIGLITTKGDETTEGARSLRALTLSYIDRTMREETGFSLLQNMQGDLSYRSEVFREALAPFLARILAAELE